MPESTSRVASLIDALLVRYTGGNLPDTLAGAEQFIAEFPQHPFGWKLKGALLIGLQQPEAAIAVLQTALALDPQASDAHNNLGIALRQTGQLRQALQASQRALEIAPEFAQAHHAVAVVLLQMGELALALQHGQQAIRLQPAFPEAWFNLGNIYKDARRNEEALHAYRQALQLRPDMPDVLNNLGNLLREAGKTQEALALYKKAQAIQPLFATTELNLGNLFLDVGQYETAAQHYHAALQCDSTLIGAQSNLCFCQASNPHADCALRLREVQHYQHMLAQTARPYTHRPVVQTAGSRLKVGLVSGDLCQHPVGYFLEGVLADLAQTEIELWAYPSFPHEDALTQRLKPHFAGWRSLVGLSDEEAARQIHADGIHILIDLAGHTAHNRLPVFAWKPAPVQVSWLGYFATTGVAQMDYLLADEVGVPEQHQNQFTEKIWYLPETRLCFTPPENAPAVAPASCVAKGSITFGCFQNLAKIGDAVLVQWQRILAAVPDARLRVQNKALGDEAVRQHFTERLQQHGIDPQRVDLHGNSPREQYLAAHAEVDILLDTFPYPGGTTTCEALWMGVPTVTLAGDTLLARQGASLLTAAGLADWVACSAEDYVAKATTFAQDGAALSAMRAGLRDKVAASPLFDAKRFARNFHAALQGMWQGNWSTTPSLQQQTPSASTTDVDRASMVALFNQGQYAACEALAQQCLRHNPGFGFAWNVLGVLYKQWGRIEEALAAMERAAELLPDDVEVLNNYGATLQNLHRSQAAEPYLRRAIALKPDYVEAYSNLAATLHELDRYAEAESCLRQAIALRPSFPEAWYNLGNTLKQQGRLHEAEEALLQALSLRADWPSAHTMLLFCLNYGQHQDAARRLAHAVDYGALLTRMASPAFSDWRCDRSARRLRVGLVSPDLRTHPVGYFLEGVLADLAQTGIELWAYPSFPHEDALTQRLKPHFAGWRSLVGLSDEEAARQIHADGIHILVDLAGHTAHNRLPVFAWKPAPVQVSWLGYFATTGVAQMDYLLADEVGVPPQHQSQFTEQIWYLPETRLCFTPPENAPAVAPAPCVVKGAITFGCFQNLAKIGDAVLVQWQRILAGVPDARLRLQNKALGDEAVRQHFIQRLQQHGIDPQRVDLHGNSPRQQYLAAHAEVDILLDTFPYPGGTTTCEALWMGAPTVTLAGDTLLARQGASLLTAAGLPDWVASSADDYVAKACAFAQDRTALARLRVGLRDQVAASPLFDAKRFARNFHAALQGMWQKKFDCDSRKKPMETQKVFLHVGCGPQNKAGTTSGFNTPEWNELRLDIDARVNPDIIGSMTDMSGVADASVDAIFSSHNIEHLYPHEVPLALAEFLRVLKPEGFLVLTCPDLQSVCALVAEDKLTDAAYMSPAGPIAPIDILYGHRAAMTKGNLYMAHRCGFTKTVMIGTLRDAGFATVAVANRAHPFYDLWVIASKQSASHEAISALAAAHIPGVE